MCIKTALEKTPESYAIIKFTFGSKSCISPMVMFFLIHVKCFLRIAVNTGDALSFYLKTKDDQTLISSVLHPYNPENNPNTRVGSGNSDEKLIGTLGKVGNRQPTK